MGSTLNDYFSIVLYYGVLCKTINAKTLFKNKID